MYSSKTNRITKLAAVALVLILAVTGFAAACQQVAETPAEEKIRVIVSILPLADFVENIGGERVAVTVMVPPGSSPHTFAPTPGQLRAVSHAQMYVKVGSGLGFERAWMDRIRAQNEEMLIIDGSVGIEPIHGGCPCCAPGDLDPHIWLSPLNARFMLTQTGESPVLLLDEVLSELDPQRREHLLGAVSNYRQVLITTTDLDRFPSEFLARAERFMVADGMVKPA
ncbi:zinc ABC transporter substrate-binding protein [Dehalococcoidia bacterium]|nr:zinc ABC transporter substrate-binding protein [Dehalococcoidia bacterium]